MNEHQPDKWFVRKPDGAVYGPETIDVLREWAAECRIVVGNEVSQDKHTWIAVEDVPELQMDWVAELPDGRKFGPFHLMASHELHRHGVLPPEAKLINRHNDKSCSVEELLQQKKRHRQKSLFDDNDSTDTEKTTENSTTREIPAPRKSQKTDKDKTASTEKKQEQPEQPPEAASKAESMPPANNDETQKMTDESTNGGETQKLQKQLDALNATLAAEREMFETRLREATEALELLEKRLKEKDDQHREEYEEWMTEREKIERELAAQRELCDVEMHEVKEIREKLQKALEQKEEEAEKHSRELAQWKSRVKNMEHENSSMRIAVERTATHGPVVNIVLGILAVMVILSAATCIYQRNSESIPYAVDNRQNDSNESVVTPEQSVSPQPQISSGADSAITLPKVADSSDKINLQIKGVSTEWLGPNCRITFDESPFVSMARLKPQAENQIKQIVQAIMPHIDNYKIMLVGHTDNQPLPAGSSINNNKELALARARTGHEIMKKNGIPENKMITRAGDPEKAPHPNDTAVSRRKNRTIVINLIKL